MLLQVNTSLWANASAGQEGGGTDQWLPYWTNGQVPLLGQLIAAKVRHCCSARVSCARCSSAESLLLLTWWYFCAAGGGADRERAEGHRGEPHGLRACPHQQD